MGGLNDGGDLMSLAPKCDMFLESLCQEQSFCTIRKAGLNLSNLGYTWLYLAQFG